jgi:hypothetical protein
VLNSVLEKLYLNVFVGIGLFVYTLQGNVFMFMVINQTTNNIGSNK